MKKELWNSSKVFLKENCLTTKIQSNEISNGFNLFLKKESFGNDKDKQLQKEIPTFDSESDTHLYQQLNSEMHTRNNQKISRLNNSVSNSFIS